MILLTEDNYLLTCAKYYDNSEINTFDELREDLNRIICVKKLIDKYNLSGNINLRLLLNHIIVMHNSLDFLVPSLFRLKLNDVKYLSVLKSLFVFLGYIKDGDWDDINIDRHILNKLQEI